MKKTISFGTAVLAMCSMVIFSACSKDDDTTPVATAKISATHASPGAPAVDIYVDAVKATTSQLSFPGTTGTAGNPYLTVNAGTRNIKVSPNGTLNVINANVTVTANAAYSIFAYDTLGTGTTLKALLLGDNLTAPAAGKTHIRFLHLSPDAPAVDLELVKTGSAAINLNNIPYVGSTPNTTALSAFTPIDAGTYTINVRATGTTGVVLNPTLTLAEGKIYTIYARGLLANGVATALGLNASVIQHN